MKRVSIFPILLAMFFCTTQASAQEPSTYRTGLGVRFSSAPAIVNNSVTLKHFLGESTAIEALFSFGDPLALGALYEIHKPFGQSGLRWFYGAGGYIGFVKHLNTTTNKEESRVNFGAMGVVGLDYKFTNLPLNLSLDWKPELNIVSDIFFEPAAVGLSARFTF